MVFLSIAALFFLIFSASLFRSGYFIGSAYLFLVLGILAIGGLIAIILTGAFSAARACKDNNHAIERKRQLVKEASSIVSQQ